jgi:hypothetical protein
MPKSGRHEQTHNVLMANPRAHDADDGGGIMKRLTSLAAGMFAAAIMAGAPAQAQTLVYCYEAAPETFMPLQMVGQSTGDVTIQMYNTLFEQGARRGSFPRWPKATRCRRTARSMTSGSGAA